MKLKLRCSGDRPSGFGQVSVIAWAVIHDGKRALCHCVPSVCRKRVVSDRTLNVPGNPVTSFVPAVQRLTSSATSHIQCNASHPVQRLTSSATSHIQCNVSHPCKQTQLECNVTWHSLQLGQSELSLFTSQNCLRMVRINSRHLNPARSTLEEGC
jgi:hypothetical protein